MDIKVLERKLQQFSEQNLLDIEAAKQKGRKVIGFYCLYAPIELAVAAGAVPVSLCGTRHDPITEAEKFLPRNLCPLIKSSFGFAVSDTCPYFRFSDLVVGETTCDGKKKMFELLAAYRPMHILHLPQSQELPTALAFWREEIIRFKERVKRETGAILTAEKITSAIRLMNRERRSKQALMDLGRLHPPPLSGLEMMNILFRTAFFMDKEQGISLMGEFVEALHAKWQKGERPFSDRVSRILLSGVPVGLGSHKVVQLIEKAGAVVVAFETCSGYRGIEPVAEDKESIEALAEKYLNIPCSVMSPNPGRRRLLVEMIRDFQVEGVIDLAWQACHTYHVESHFIEKTVSEECGLPYLHLETDYSETDTEQLAVRIEAFLELVRENGKR